MIKNIVLILAVIFLFGCKKDPSAIELIERSVKNLSTSDTIRTFTTFANCISPRGAYTTEIHSGEDDYTYFKQVFSYKDLPYEAVVLNLDSAFEVPSDTMKAQAISKETISVLKSHEFHEILFDLKNRFHDFGEPKLTKKDALDQYTISAKDELNNPVNIFLDRETAEVKGFSMGNPDKVQEVITVEYSDRRLVQGVMLPMKVKIMQGPDKQFDFNFTTVEINAREFAHWKDVH